MFGTNLIISIFFLFLLMPIPTTPTTIADVVRQKQKESTKSDTPLGHRRSKSLFSSICGSDSNKNCDVKTLQSLPEIASSFESAAAHKKQPEKRIKFAGHRRVHSLVKCADCGDLKVSNKIPVKLEKPDKVAVDKVVVETRKKTLLQYMNGFFKKSESEPQIPVKIEENLTTFECEKNIVKELDELHFTSDLNGVDGVNVVHKIKLRLHHPMDAGKFAKFYQGCYKFDGIYKKIGVKLIGKGTLSSPGQKKVENLEYSVKEIQFEGALKDARNESDFLRHIEEMKKTRKDLPMEHVIGFFDSGDVDKIVAKREIDENYFQYVTMMELGEMMNFLEYFIKLHLEQNLVEEAKIMEILAEPAEVLAEFHKVAVHSDLKPQNLLYVTDAQTGVKILKIIDFGGSTFLPGIIPGRIIPTELERITSTRQYLPREMDSLFQSEKIEIRDIKLFANTKSDVWQFGVMICYLLLYTLPYEGKSANNEDWRRNLINRLGLITRMYKEMNEWKTKEDIKNLHYYKMPITDVLQIRELFPLDFLLVSNILLHLPKARLSAEGVSGFLRKNCGLVKPLDVLFDDYLDKNKFIGIVSMKKLKGMDNEWKAMIERGDKNLKEALRSKEWLNLPECDRSYRPGEEEILRQIFNLS